MQFAKGEHYYQMLHFIAANIMQLKQVSFGAKLLNKLVANYKEFQLLLSGRSYNFMPTNPNNTNMISQQPQLANNNSNFNNIPNNNNNNNNNLTNEPKPKFRTPKTFEQRRSYNFQSKTTKYTKFY